uniref:Uncharacterized protein n=1 Tax=Arundo donax TaxID=35708 RepID=A0A0A8YZB5_ARUDO
MPQISIPDMAEVLAAAANLCYWHSKSIPETHPTSLFASGQRRWD